MRWRELVLLGIAIGAAVSLRGQANGAAGGVVEGAVVAGAAPGPAGQTVAAGEVQRVDPTLIKPVEALTPDQVRGMQKRLGDWADLARYRESNAALGAPEAGRVVFLGDSITDSWGRMAGTTFFPGKPYVNRGVSGQTTPQMLVRFEQDVVGLKPAAVVILAGTNDIAGNTGISTLGMVEDNFKAMVAIAQANGIKVVLSSVMPVSEYPWRRGIEPAGKIRALNAWMKEYAAAHGCTYLDYYTALVDKDGGMRAGTSKEGVHPTPEGYAVMAPLAEAAIVAALKP